MGWRRKAAADGTLQQIGRSRSAAPDVLVSLGEVRRAASGGTHQSGSADGGTARQYGDAPVPGP